VLQENVTRTLSSVVYRDPNSHFRSMLPRNTMHALGGCFLPGLEGVGYGGS